MHLMLRITLILLILIPQLNARRKEQKPSTSQPKKAIIEPRIDTDKLPPLDDLLKELGMSNRIKEFIKMGVTETRILLRLKKMDFQIMRMDWDNVEESEIKKLQETIEKLTVYATVKEEVVDPALGERMKLSYGRIFVSDFVQSFEYVSASFGSKPALGPISIITANPVNGCSPMTSGEAGELIDNTGKLVLVHRGDCTFLDKALIAIKNNATGLAIINSEDRLESAASGYGLNPNITENLVHAVKNLTIISLSNTSFASLQYAQIISQSPLLAHIVPLQCGTGESCHPLLESEKQLLPEVTWGTVRIRSAEEVRSFEFLTSNFGGMLPTNPLTVVSSQPLHACDPLLPLEFSGKGSAVLVVRGGCSFDLKAKHVESAGGRMMIIYDEMDSALQRLGGRQPLAGSVGIPSIIVTSIAGKFLSTGLSEGNVPVIELLPASDTRGADDWIELAYFNWSEDDDAEKLAQIDSMLQKYRLSSDISAWLKRKSVELQLKSVRSVETDEL